MPEFFWGTGRRKSAVARVRLGTGTGQIVVNGKPYDKYFCTEQDRLSVIQPLKICNRLDKYDVFVQVEGGGSSGQAGAIKHGLARALWAAEGDGLAPLLKANKLLTRDPRMKERKKYGLHGARRGQQYSKR